MRTRWSLLCSRAASMSLRTCCARSMCAAADARTHIRAYAGTRVHAFADVNAHDCALTDTEAQA
eukprot:6196555-Pleurochrysis_carterae.AAC.2